MQLHFSHWQIIFPISVMNRKAGIRFLRWSEAVGIYQQVKCIQHMHHLDYTIGNA
jgi:hypothetical protein